MPAYDTCKCGKRKRKVSKVCQECRYPHGYGNATETQLRALKLSWYLDGNRKAVAEFMKISVKTLEYHFAELTNKIAGREDREKCSYVMPVLFKWGVRAGILSCLIFSCYARPWWKHSPPPPPPTTPPSSNYQTNAKAWWPPVANASAYQINGSVGPFMTLGTNYTITGLTNGSNYFIFVQAVVSNQWSQNSCSVSFTAGSGIDNFCPSTASLPTLNATNQ